MKIFLSALENAHSFKHEGSREIADVLIERKVKMYWNLVSYYYVRGARERLAERIRDNSELLLVDSGAHSFQFGKKVDWTEYTKEYAQWIAGFDRPNVLGYFEMDIENIIGYDNVLKLRAILESVSDKIIPVWHPTRGINDYEEMCKKYEGKIVAIGGFRGTDIKDEQFLSFVKVARKYGCKVHCLGMTRAKVLDKVPFDFTDSSAWLMSATFGRIGSGNFDRGKVSHAYSKQHRIAVLTEGYKQGVKMQQHYYRRWRKECND